MKDGGERKEMGKVRRLNWIRWAAAAVLIGVAGWWGVRQLQPNDSALYAKVYSDPSWQTERGGEENELAEITVKYFEGDESGAKSDLKGSSIADKNYWLAELYLREMKFDSTLLYLPTAVDSDNKLKRDRINYLKILSLYFSGNRAEAETVIQDLPEDTDTYYRDVYDQLGL